MEARKIHPDRTIIELTPEEVEELKRAVARITQSFLGVPPIFKRINAELLSLNEAVQIGKTFTGDGSTYRPDSDEESFPIRAVPDFANGGN